MVDVIVVADQFAHFLVNPDGIEADSTVEELALLEHESAVKELGDFLGDPSVLPGVSLDSFHDGHQQEQEHEVDRSCDQDEVEHDSGKVDQVGHASTFQTLLLVRQLVIGVESIFDQVHEVEDRVADQNEHDDRTTVLDLIPLLHAAAGPANALLIHVAAAAENIRWEVRDRVHDNRRDDQHKGE